MWWPSFLEMEVNQFFGVAFDGGFQVSGNMPLFELGEIEEVQQVITSSGRKIIVAPQASFGSISSGGLY